MIRERAMELVAALRSGKYKQTDGRLRHENTYCCLGVACEISNLSKWDDKNIHDDGIHSYLGQESLLPESVMEYFGFHSDNGLASGDDLIVPRPTQDPDEPRDICADNLVDLNDGGATFEEIATLIENNWERL